MGDDRKSLEYFIEALTIQKKSYGNEHAAVANTLKNLGVAWTGLGDVKKAMDYFHESVQLLITPCAKRLLVEK